MERCELNRRGFLRLAVLGAAGVVAAGCQPRVVEVEKVVKETVVQKETVVMQEATPSPKQAVTITDLVWGFTAQMVGLYELFAQSFHEANPHITVEYLFVPDFITKLKTMEAAGTPPDVVMPIGGYINLFRGPDYSTWLDLKPLIDRDNYDMSDFSEFSVGVVTNPFTKAIEGIPIQVFCNYIAYNKTLFQKAGLPEPPHSWEDTSWTPQLFLEYAKKLTLDNKGRTPDDAGFDASNIVQWGVEGHWNDTIWGWIWGGEDLQTDPNDRRTVRIAESPFIEGWNFRQDMIYKLNVYLPPLREQEIRGLLPVAFNSGKVGMRVGAATWNLSVLATIKDFEWDVAPGFVHPDTGRHASVLYQDQGCITAKARHPDEAWEWIKYVSVPGMAERFSVDLRQCLPARISLTPKYVERLQGQFGYTQDLKVVADALPYAPYKEFWAPPTEWPEIWQPVSDAIMTNEKSPAEGLTEVAPKIQANWDEYYARF